MNNNYKIYVVSDSIMEHVDDLLEMKSDFHDELGLEKNFDLEHFKTMEKDINFGNYYLFSVNDEIVGYSIIYNTKFFANLSQFYIKKEHRNKGYGFYYFNLMLTIYGTLNFMKKKQDLDKIENFIKLYNKFPIEIVSDEHSIFLNIFIYNPELETTFFIIKPDGMVNHHNISNIFKENGYHIKSLKRISPDETREKLKEHYSHIIDKPFYSDVENYMTSGEIIIGKLTKYNAIEDFRKLMGTTNPEQADEGTIRKKYGKVIDGKIFNVIHGSDSKESYEREIKIWF